MGLLETAAPAPLAPAPEKIITKEDIDKYLSNVPKTGHAYIEVMKNDTKFNASLYFEKDIEDAFQDGSH